jgi:RNA polymerase sigma factor (sigma-70 family)
MFERHRAHLHAVAYRMLGSASAADDALQEAWLRFDGADTEDVENMRGWLTTVVSRVCLNVLRERRRRREVLSGVSVPDPVVTRFPADDPAHQTELADSVGAALLVVLERLTPPQRLAFVLHDVFAVPFDEIALLLDRTPDAARQLASRARRVVQTSPSAGDAALQKQREVVAAFFRAARRGEFDSLVALLDPDIVLRSDGGKARPEATARVHGAAEVASRAMMFASPAASIRYALVNGRAGAVITVDERPISIMEFTVRDNRITEIVSLADPDRLATIDTRDIAAAPPSDSGSGLS